jgi:hypothetical protein
MVIKGEKMEAKAMETKTSEKKYSVRNIKTFRGMEGKGFNATLYRNNTKVALVIDDANGGDYMFEWCDALAPKVEIHITTDKGVPHTFFGTLFEKEFYDYLETLPREPSKYFPDGMKVDGDIFVSNLVEKYELEQWFKRNLKKNFLFQVGKDIDSNTYQMIKKDGILTLNKVEDYIKSKYPSQEFKVWEYQHTCHHQY